MNDLSLRPVVVMVIVAILAFVFAFRDTGPDVVPPIDEPVIPQIIPPVFHNLFIDSRPEAGEWIRISLYYRLHGCDSAGGPTLYSGVQDLDYATEPPVDRDLTDNWQYRVAVERIDGAYEPVWICDENAVRAMGEGEWVDDPLFVWLPYYAEARVPAGLGCDSFPPKDRSDLTPKSCTPSPGPVPDPAEGEPTHKIHVWVMEFGEVYHEVYHVWAIKSHCD